MVARRGFSERLALIVLATGAMYLGSCPGAWAGPPEAVASILVIHDGSDWCHGTPVGIVQILTAAHCVGSGEVSWDGQGRSGTARLLWRDDKRDIAMMTAETPQTWSMVRIAKAKPSSAEPLWVRTFVPRVRSVVAPVTFLGLDDDGDYDLWGYGPPGTSGSGVLNGAGELVAVVKMVFNPYEAAQRPQTMGDTIDVLVTSVKFAPAIVAVPITEWPKPKERR